MRKIKYLLFAALLSAGLISCAPSAPTQTGGSVANQTADSEPSDSQTLEVHFIDVGQGDAILIKSEEHAMLIDAGDNSKGTAVQYYLNNQNVTELDYVIGTHPDADHIGGLDVILTKFDCGTVFLPETTSDTATYRDVLDALSYRGYSASVPTAGDSYALGGANFTFLTPTGEAYGDNTNNDSIGILLTNGNHRFLFLGDAEAEAEQDILSRFPDLKADVYKVSHHGSRSSSTEAFLQAIRPSYAVISCGADNKYGHPHAQTLNTLRAMGVKVFRTDEQGSIIAYSDGTELTFSCAPSESWQSGEGSASDWERKPAAAEKNTEDPSSIQPDTASGSYILNTGSLKFHLPDCSSAAQIQDKNKAISSESRNALLAQGYTPCQRCNP